MSRASSFATSNGDCASPLAGEGQSPERRDLHGQWRRHRDDQRDTRAWNQRRRRIIPFGGRLAASNLVATVTTGRHRHRPAPAADRASARRRSGSASRTATTSGCASTSWPRCCSRWAIGDASSPPGQLDNQSAGGSGFNNAVLNTIPLTLKGAPVLVPAGCSARIQGVGAPHVLREGHAAGTVLLWYNGAHQTAGTTGTPAVASTRSAGRERRSVHLCAEVGSGAERDGGAGEDVNGRVREQHGIVHDHRWPPIRRVRKVGSSDSLTEHTVSWRRSTCSSKAADRSSDRASGIGPCTTGPTTRGGVDNPAAIWDHLAHHAARTARALDVVVAAPLRGGFRRRAHADSK